MKDIITKCKRIYSLADAINIRADNLLEVKNTLEKSINKDILCEISDDKGSIDVINMHTNRRIFRLRPGDWVTIESDQMTLLKWTDMVFKKLHNLT